LQGKQAMARYRELKLMIECPRWTTPKPNYRHEKSISPVFGLAGTSAVTFFVGRGFARSPTKFPPHQFRHWAGAGFGR